MHYLAARALLAKFCGNKLADLHGRLWGSAAGWSGTTDGGAWRVFDDEVVVRCPQTGASIGWASGLCAGEDRYEGVRMESGKWKACARLVRDGGDVRSRARR
jgi:hypothetical protein